MKEYDVITCPYCQGELIQSMGAWLPGAAIVFYIQPLIRFDIMKLSHTDHSFLFTHIKKVWSLS